MDTSSKTIFLQGHYNIVKLLITSKMGESKNFIYKKIQSELLKDVHGDKHRSLQCNADTKKTAAIFSLQEQMVETTR